MKIKTKCEHCGKVYQMEDSYLGQTAQCRHCNNYFTMAFFNDQPAPPSPQPPAQPPPRQPGYEQPQLPPQAPARGQGTPGQPLTDTRTVVCPKCEFTADIPRIGRKLKLTCQECGKKFLVKPEPKSGRPEKERGSSKTTALVLILLFLVVLAAVLINVF